MTGDLALVRVCGERLPQAAYRREPQFPRVFKTVSPESQMVEVVPLVDFRRMEEMHRDSQHEVARLKAKLDLAMVLPFAMAALALLARGVWR